MNGELELDELRGHFGGRVLAPEDPDDEDRAIAGFGRENYDRLAALKAELDPDNVFRLNHNVQPAVA